MSEKELDSENLMIPKTTILDLLNSVSRIEIFNKEQEIVIATLKKQLNKAIENKTAEVN